MRAVALIVWVGFGLPTGFIAQGKGYGGCLWLLPGLVLGPIGLLVAIAMRPVQSLQSDEDLLLQGRARCESCREVVMVESVKCPHCGERRVNGSDAEVS